MVIFGTIYPGAPMAEFAKEVEVLKKRKKLQVSLTIIGSNRGKNRKAYEEIVKVWEAYGLDVELLGEQPIEKISEVIGSATIGISTTPIALCEKSGSIAAMRAHRLPILCVARQYYPREVHVIKHFEGIEEYHFGNLENFLECLRRPSSHFELSEISKHLYDVFRNRGKIR